MSATAPVRSLDQAPLAREVHDLVRDLMRPKLRIYWTDFLCTSMVAYLATFAYLELPDWTLAQASAFTVASIAIYRAVVFTHELAHLSPRKFHAFRVV